MGRIREILLSQYIGAITIGFLAAQAVIAFVSGVMQAMASYYGPNARSLMAENRASMAWFTFVDNSITAVLYLAIAYYFFAGCIWEATKQMTSWNRQRQPSGSPTPNDYASVQCVI
jgi:uncharacterized membrane protein SpoIIM required for sporulation